MPSPMPKDICCRNFKGLFSHVRQAYGRQGISNLTEGLLDGNYFVQDKYAPDRIVPISEEHLSDAAYWVSNEFSLALLSNIKRVVRTSLPLFTAGRSMVQQGLSRTDLFFARVAGIEILANRAAKLNACFNRTKDVHLAAFEPGRAVFELHYRPGFRVTKDVCQWNLGIYVGIAQLSGVADASGREVACVLNGDSHCRFEIQWQQRNLVSRLIRLPANRLLRAGTRELVSEYERVIEERDRLIERLTGSEAKYRRLFENSLDPMSLSQKGTLVDVNRAWLELHGYSHSVEVLGKDVIDFLHPDDRHILFERRAKWPRQKERLVQMRDLTAAGESKIVEVYSTSIKIGGETAILATIHDITESKKTQEALKGIEEQLRLFIENTPAPVAICDRKMRYLAYSRRWIEDYKLPSGNLIGEYHYDVFESIPDKWQQEHQRCFAGEIIDNEEEPFQRADGSEDWVRRKVYPWRDRNGRIGGLIMFTEVITHRKLAEAALKASEEQYRKLVENASDAIFIDQDGAIKFPNPRALKLFGLHNAPMQPIALRMFVHPNDRDRIIQLLQKGVESNRPVEAIFTFVDHWGNEYRMQMNAVPIEWDRNPAVLVFLRDITEQQQLSESLRQSQKFEAIGTLAGGIAHDFNNLLMGIQGHTSLMAANPDVLNLARDHLGAVEDHVRSAAGLTQQLLGFALGGKYEVKPIDVNELVRNSSAMFGRTRKKIRINRRLRAQPAVIAADRSQMEQVLLNMYINAWQAMPDGGEMAIETSTVMLDGSFCEPHQIAPGRYVRITIRDTGIGMEDSILQQVFDPFFTTKSKSRGTGLGLASAYGIIKNHGGCITVSSQPGRGATFTVNLPASDQTAAAEPPRIDGLMTGSETILLVDDEPMILEVGKAMLEKLGYKVIAAADGLGAVEIVRRKRSAIDLVILDLIMPGLDGAETFDRIRDVQPDLLILLSSGYTIDEQAETIMEKGCNGFIQKPFNLAGLSNKVRSILDGVQN